MLVIVIAGLIVVSIAIFLSEALDSTSGNLAVNLVKTATSAEEPTATFQLMNGGKTAIFVDDNCAVYWTNEAGLATNAFFHLKLTSQIIKPTQSAVVIVASPPGACVWSSSFSYSTVPGACKRLWMRLRNLLNDSGVFNEYDQTFSCRLSPPVTNCWP